MRKYLIQMYLDIYGEENVNLHWLNILTDDDIMKMIVSAGKLGAAVNRLTPDHNMTNLRVSLGAYRRQKEEK